MVQHFVSCLNEGRPVGPGLRAGRAVTDVVLAVHESLATGATVRPGAHAA
ncbi:hypothetical protein MMF93_01065 [Streptomyces tubbatahanensis]|uniref:Oxidoreductase n=1 Tax=Streptomyces tubbatahanensis TaxID=2923272 RepID=A0ABY3XL99_9ACTN|nr:hypothetical protein [Streptomyces tubbatahanensis]UNS95203.1 hypothetical protein MMF93_01065 [Streptomyces tubbatahanensis]